MFNRNLILQTCKSRRNFYIVYFVRERSQVQTPVLPTRNVVMLGWRIINLKVFGVFGLAWMQSSCHSDNNNIEMYNDSRKCFLSSDLASFAMHMNLICMLTVKSEKIHGTKLVQYIHVYKFKLYDHENCGLRVQTLLYEVNIRSIRVNTR